MEVVDPLVRTHGRVNDDILLSPLETVHRVHLDGTLASIDALQFATDGKDLLVVRTDDSELAVFEGGEVGLQVGVDLQNDIDFSGIAEGRVDELLLSLTVVEHELLEGHVGVDGLGSDDTLDLGGVLEL